MKKYVCYYFFPFLCGVCNQILTNNVLPVFPRIATSRNSLFLKVKFITLHMPKHWLYLLSRRVHTSRIARVHNNKIHLYRWRAGFFPCLCSYKYPVLSLFDFLLPNVFPKYSIFNILLSFQDDPMKYYMKYMSKPPLFPDLDKQLQQKNQTLNYKDFVEIQKKRAAEKDEK